MILSVILSRQTILICRTFCSTDLFSITYRFLCYVTFSMSHTYSFLSPILLTKRKCLQKQCLLLFNACCYLLFMCISDVITLLVKFCNDKLERSGFSSYLWGLHPQNISQIPISWIMRDHCFLPFVVFLAFTKYLIHR